VVFLQKEQEVLSGCCGVEHMIHPYKKKKEKKKEKEINDERDKEREEEGERFLLKEQKSGQLLLCLARDTSLQ
jgi:hypothetical protein